MTAQTTYSSVVELQQALVNGNYTAFSLETIKMLFDMFDNDRSGTIGVQEFGGIWAYINQWQQIFAYYDRDRSGTMDNQELGAALQQFGFNLPPRTIYLLQQKYGSKGASPNQNSVGGFQRGPPPAQAGITFDHFIRCCVSVRALTDAFRKADQQGQGYAQFQYNQFLDIVLSAP